MAEFMGVRVDPINQLPDGNLEIIKEPLKPSGRIESGSAGYRLDGRLNDSFRAVSLLLNDKIQVFRADKQTGELRLWGFHYSPGTDSGN